jgi:hypothetical protein
VAGCGRSDDRAAEQERTGATPDANVSRSADVPAPIVETGCLTGSEGKYVLTDLEPGGGGRPRAATETYQLVGNDSELQQHVGKRVRISGEAEPAEVAEAREVTPPAPPATGTGGRANPPAAAGAPQVSTQSETRLEVSRLRVSAVTPTGEDCLERESR